MIFFNRVYNSNLLQLKIKQLIILISFLLNIYLKFRIYNNHIKIINNNSQNDLKEIQEFININLNETLINPILTKKNIKPKISIVISVYNGEPFLKTAIRSIQNQDFKEIEIIIVDDFSLDNSSKLIEELMKEDERIIFMKNNKNMGALFTKTKGILKARGKYVMTLDVDDLYASRYAFSSLYEEAEINKLDILGFASLISGKNITNQILEIHHYFDTPILFQPYVSQRMYIHDNNGLVKRTGDVIWCYFFKTKLFLKAIKEVKNYFLNRYMNVHDDFLLFFLLTRKAKNLKQVKKIYHILLLRPNEDPKIIFHNKEKEKSRKKTNCFSYLSYIEFLLGNTKDNYYDKEIASYELEVSFLKTSCIYNNLIRQEAIRICKLFLDNKHINNIIKEKIISYLQNITNL